MSVTLNVSNAVVYAQTLIKNQQLNVNNLEPGITMANTVLQRMLGSPFVWRFNRATLSVAITTAGGTDYVVSMPTLGRIEKQWLVDGDGKIHALKGAVELAASSDSRRPVEVAPVYDDNMGNITLRFNSVPDQAYTAYFDYQQKAPLLTSYASTFGPVPDEFGYLFNKGFLSEAAQLVNDARFELWRREYVFGLLSAQDGMDAQAADIFLEQMLNTGRTAQRSQAAGQMGNQGKGI
jgi:hypothetical protein